MSLPHLSSGQRTSLLSASDTPDGAPTRALLKEGQLEVMRLVLAAGQRLPPHAVPGQVTIQCLAGEAVIGVGSELRHETLVQGDFLYLGGGVEHDVRAASDSVLLVTIVLPVRAGA